ncbi:unnamed protein product [Heterobilharzia americana]|nr:unnamed protein product [Heterobilharzia americana]CAH8532235.1 unnamed protein product [Heterobilharzia americana]
MNQDSEKVYGLSFPTRQLKGEQNLCLSSVFNAESDEEDEREFRKIDHSGTTSITQSRINRKTKTDLEKAYEEDPSIFQYDEILDEIHEKKSKDICAPNSRKSKYVSRLIKASNERKLERELCAERKAQKDIETEADLFGEKDSFVTPAYKNKLNELRELVKKQTEAEQWEDVMDIRKQDGLGGFYRFMYESQNAPSTSRDCQQRHLTSENQGTPDTDSRPTQLIKESSEDEGDGNDIYKSTLKSIGTSNKSVSLHLLGGKLPHNKGVSKSASTMDNSISKKGNLRTDHPLKTGVKTGDVNEGKKSTSGVILARPRVTTDEELTAAHQRYLARKAAGIHAVIVESD